MARKNNFFKAFCKVSKAFGTTLSKSELLDLLVESAIETMDAKAACLFMEDRTKDIYVPVAQKGLSDNYLHAKPIQAKKIAETIVEKGHLAILDATTDPRVENHDLKKIEGIASILTVPIMVEDRCIGVLSLYTAKKRAFSEDDIFFLNPDEVEMVMIGPEFHKLQYIVNRRRPQWEKLRYEQPPPVFTDRSDIEEAVSMD